MSNPRVEKLKKRIENNREERAAYQRMYDQLHLYTRQIVDAPQRTRYPFWCDECQADFFAIGYKVVRKRPGILPIAWYVGYCPKRHKCIRRITDRTNDPYFVRSFAVRRDRVRYKDDLLTPDDPRFWLLYGHKHGYGGFRNIENYKPPSKDELRDLLKEKQDKKR